MRTLRLPAPVARGLAHLGLLGVGQAAAAAAAFVTQIALARALSQGDYGRFTATVSLATLAVPAALLGTGEFWLQRFGREGPRAYRWVGVTLRLTTVATVAVVVALAGRALLLGRADPTAAAVGAILAPLVAGQVAVALGMAALQLRGAYGGVAALQLAPQLARLAVAAAVWAFGWSVLAAAAGYAVVAVACVAAGALLVRPLWRGRFPLAGHDGAEMAAASHEPATRGAVHAGTGAGAPGRGARWRAPSPRSAFAGSAPFMLGSAFYLAGMHLGVVVAAACLDPGSAALLAVPMAILGAVYLIPRVVYQQYFLPRLHRWARWDRDAILAAYRLGAVGMSGLGVLCAAGVVVLGWTLVPALFGEEYAPARPILALLALAIPLRFASASVASLLTSGGQVRRKVLYQGVGAAIYLAALWAGIRAWGLPGAAVATVAAEGIQFLLFWRCVRRDVIRGARVPRWAAIRARLASG